MFSAGRPLTQSALLLSLFVVVFEFLCGSRDKKRGHCSKMSAVGEAPGEHTASLSIHRGSVHTSTATIHSVVDTHPPARPPALTRSATRSPTAPRARHNPRKFSSCIVLYCRQQSFTDTTPRRCNFLSPLLEGLQGTVHHSFELPYRLKVN